ncbi:MAG: hypothetical protein D8M57_01970 [Candidatus Scalindua sp. AMX11]|nr:MAG: hypothetical protein DWQ00_13330 [Candidatus Scalindua sp.]TDE66504.1 MAG: hypothetical protein D8M57_01970 [Candidatus Scalindua sp. AMX11]
MAERWITEHLNSGELLVLGIGRHFLAANNIMTELKKMDEQPNLLIIDNAENSLSTLYDYLPEQPLWHILVTSRQQITKFDGKELGFLSEDEAINLFLSHYTLGKLREEEIKELVRTVDLHTF